MRKQAVRTFWSVFVLENLRLWRGAAHSFGAYLHARRPHGRQGAGHPRLGSELHGTYFSGGVAGQGGQLAAGCGADETGEMGFGAKICLFLPLPVILRHCYTHVL